MNAFRFTFQSHVHTDVCTFIALEGLASMLLSGILGRRNVLLPPNEWFMNEKTEDCLLMLPRGFLILRGNRDRVLDYAVVNHRVHKNKTRQLFASRRATMAETPACHVQA